MEKAVNGANVGLISLPIKTPTNKHTRRVLLFMTPLCSFSETVPTQLRSYQLTLTLVTAKGKAPS